jgi:hypothetical protein
MNNPRCARIKESGVAGLRAMGGLGTVGAAPSKKRRGFNFCLILSAVVIGIVALIGLVVSLDRSARLATELVDLSKLAGNPAPCGIGAPNLLALAAGAHLVDVDPITSSLPNKEADVARAVRSALCSTEFPSVAVKRLQRRSKGVTNSNVESTLCSDAKEGGDPLVRIKRAYLRSGTAFARYYGGSAGSSLTTDTDCAWTSGPFGVGCENGATVRAALRDAAEDNPIYGGASAVPDTTNALYRLAALALVAYEDRKRGKTGAKCFGNAAGANAADVCADVFAGASAVAGTNTGEPFETWYAHADVQTCNGKAAGASSYSIGYADASDAALPADRRQCERQHAFALYDTTSLYGLPDFNAGPRFDEPVGGMVTIEFVYELVFENLIKAWYTDQRADEALTDPQRDLMLYAGARLGLSLFWALPAVQIACFWLAFAGLPVAINVRRILKRFGVGSGAERPNLVRAPMGPTRIVATVSSALLFFWVASVHPWPAPPTPMVDSDCGGWPDSGAVHGTTDQTRYDAYRVAIILVVVAVYSMLYSCLFRTPTDQPIERPKPTNEVAGIAVALAMVAVDGGLIAVSLGEWLDAVRTEPTPDPSLSRLVSTVDHDVRGAVATAAAGASAVASISQSYLLNNHPKLQLPWALCTAAVAWTGFFVKLGLSGSSGDLFAGTLRAFLAVGALGLQIALTVVVVLVWNNLRGRPPMKFPPKVAAKANQARAALRRLLGPRATGAPAQPAAAAAGRVDEWMPLLALPSRR